MNRLIIIGNGFDLAHGLPTRYEDFILNYFENVFSRFFQEREYEDEVLKLIDKGLRNDPQSNIQFLKTIKSNKSALVRILNNNSFHDGNGGWTIESPARVEQKNVFLDNFLKTSHEQWVDIEQFYYEKLKEVAKKEIEPNRRDHKYKGDLTDLNFGFRFLKERFELYLKEEVGGFKLNLNSKIIDIFTNNFRISGAWEDDTNTPLNVPEKLIFLNFNYTDTVSRYVQEINQKIVLKSEAIEIQIHGKVGDVTNPIIFGFGDEIDENYKLLEQRNINRYLDYIKSFGYLKTNNYRLLNKSIDTAPFEVYIMGHSCGLSDRVMLNMIFEHSNCKSIKVFYHQKDNGHNNYLDLAQNISRHFNDKSALRLKLRSEVELEPLPQLSK